MDNVASARWQKEPRGPGAFLSSWVIGTHWSGACGGGWVQSRVGLLLSGTEGGGRSREVWHGAAGRIPAGGVRGQGLGSMDPKAGDGRVVGVRERKWAGICELRICGCCMYIGRDLGRERLWSEEAKPIRGEEATESRRQAV